MVARFGLTEQEKKSPDGYRIFIAETLSHNGPTVFFELIPANMISEFRLNNINKVSSNDVPVQPVFRLTKAGSINTLIITQSDLEAQSFTDLQQLIEKSLHIPV